MSGIAKTIRFHKVHRDEVALKAYTNFADYGFASANDMAMTALYELAERHDRPGLTDLPLDTIVDKLAERLIDKGLLIAGTTEAIGPSSTCPSGPAILDAPDSVSDDDVSDIMADILNFG